MFFSLSKEPDSRFPYQDRFGSWWFNHDEGWSWIKDTWFKGYGHDELGNYVQLVQHSDCINLYHGKNRSFPLWWDDQTLTLTNLLGAGQPIRSDKRVVLFSDWLITENVDIHGTIDPSQLSRDQVVDSIVHNLESKTELLNLFSSGYNRRLFVTGGIDTVTLLAMMRDSMGMIDQIEYQHFEYDYFTNRNIEKIREKHWGYRQIHHWTSDTVLLSGASGDEYMMRGPNTVALWCAWQDINLVDILKKSTGYHVNYFLRPKNLAIFQEAYQQRDQIREQYPRYVDLIRQILDVNANDHQHWHLGRTITWTPFLDPELTKTILRLSVDDLLEQIIDAQISRDIIRRFNPILDLILSDSKNQNMRSNLHRLSDLR
jgi:hypothetical protein